VGNAGGREEGKDDQFVHKQLKVKEYRVKAKANREERANVVCQGLGSGDGLDYSAEAAGRKWQIDQFRS